MGRSKFPHLPQACAAWARGDFGPKPSGQGSSWPLRSGSAERPGLGARLGRWRMVKAGAPAQGMAPRAWALQQALPLSHSPRNAERVGHGLALPWFGIRAKSWGLCSRGAPVSFPANHAGAGPLGFHGTSPRRPAWLECSRRCPSPQSAGGSRPKAPSRSILRFLACQKHPRVR